MDGKKQDAGFSQTALATIDSASNFVQLQDRQLERMSTQVGKMNGFGLWWDSKVPDKDYCWYNFCSLLKMSDPEDVRNGIKKYQKFYGQIKEAMDEIRNGEAGDFENVEEIVVQLYEAIEILGKAAEQGKKSTDSKTLYELHKDFTEKQYKLENMIRRVENVALREKQKDLTKKWDKALKDIGNLTNELREAKEEKDKMKQCIEELRESNENAKKERKLMMEQNETIMALLDKLFTKENTSS